MGNELLPRFAAESSGGATAHWAVSGGLGQIVIADEVYERYGDFVQAAQSADLVLHFCESGRAALRFARRCPTAVWLVSTELPDMSGFDLLGLLVPLLHHDPFGSAPIRPGGPPRRSRRLVRSAIFLVSDAYREEDEQRALAAGIAGYLVRPVILDNFRETAAEPHPAAGGG
jgi:CheY-like chemotaxis protein